MILKSGDLIKYKNQIINLKWASLLCFLLLHFLHKSFVPVFHWLVWPWWPWQLVLMTGAFVPRTIFVSVSWHVSSSHWQEVRVPTYCANELITPEYNTRLLMNCGVPGLLPPGLPQWQFPVPHKTPIVEDKAVIMTLATISSPINTDNCLRFLLLVLPELIFWLVSGGSSGGIGSIPIG